MATTATTSSTSVVQVTMGGGPATSAATVPSSSSAGPSCQENSGDISDALVERVLQKLRSHPSVINAPGPSSSAQGMIFVGPIAIVTCGSQGPGAGVSNLCLQFYMGYCQACF